VKGEEVWGAAQQGQLFDYNNCLFYCSILTLQDGLAGNEGDWMDGEERGTILCRAGCNILFG